MSSIGVALLNRLRSVDRPGDFCLDGIREIFMPTIDVDGVGRIAFPLLPAQAEQLVASAQAAPYGRGTETVVDRGVRRTWQIDPGRVRISGRHWENTLAELVAEAARGLGVDGSIAADFYKLLVYDPGSFFVEHRDTEKVPGMFATMVLVLPSAHSGGELVIKHLGREAVLGVHPDQPSEIGYAAFYADCVHEVRPVTEGYRVTLVYNLRFLGKRSPLASPDFRAQQQEVAQVLRDWPGAAEEPDKLVLPLEHAYTPSELSFSALKGADAGVASVLVKAAADADCELHLALVSIEESGTAEHENYYGRRFGQGDDDAFEITEVYDKKMILSEWRRPDGGNPEFKDFPFSEEELCPPDAFQNRKPDEQHFHEATGNEGASFERTYRRAGLVVWPAARKLAVLNQAGLGTTLPYLEGLTARWETSGAKIGSALWRDADELSGHMIQSWGTRHTWRADGTEAGRMLDLQVRLGNRARIEDFLAGLSAKIPFTARANAAIVRAAVLLAPPRATELLVQIIKHNAAANLSPCGDLLRLLAAPSAAFTGDLVTAARALIGTLPGDPATPPSVPWVRPDPVGSDFVIDLLTATSQIDAGLAGRAMEHLLAWPKTYRPDGVLLPAALAFAKRAQSAAWPAVTRLREAVLGHLRKRIAVPLEPPRDWTRTNALKCKCADCRELGDFLIAPDRQKWLLKAVEGRRDHLEQCIKQTACDLDLTTKTVGRPYTLVAVKNQASYERLAKQRRHDLEHLAILGG